MIRDTFVTDLQELDDVGKYKKEMIERCESRIKEQDVKALLGYFLGIALNKVAGPEMSRSALSRVREMIRHGSEHT